MLFYILKISLNLKKEKKWKLMMIKKKITKKKKIQIKKKVKVKNKKLWVKK